jgi:hypothetical protein
VQFNPYAVRAHLRGVMYPASRDELIAAAEENGAPDRMIDDLAALRQDRFNSHEDVLIAFERA